MKSRRLGSTGRRVSEIGFGGWGIGGDQYEPAYGESNSKDSRASIRRALELGVTFFDTADIYGHGHSEALIGSELANWPDRDQVVVATKGGINFYRQGEAPEQDFTPYGLAHAVEQSRIRLRQETLDLYLLMNPPLDLLTKTDRVWETLSSLRRAGKLRWYGVSVSDPDEGVKLLKAGIKLDAVEVTYNMLFQSAALELLPLAQKLKVGVIVREPLANGFLSSRSESRAFTDGDHRSLTSPEFRTVMDQTFSSLEFLRTPTRTMAQAAIRFVLDHPAVSVVIPGMKTLAQVEENCAASTLPGLTDDERMQIHHVFFPEDEL